MVGSLSEARSVAETLSLEESDVQEQYFDRGWTDGLPIVAPTTDRVKEMLSAGDVEAHDLLGAVSERNISVSAEKVAVNAVMAGCKPEYFRVVLAAMQAVLDPGFNAHAAVTSTGGAALCLVVSGPIADEIGMNSLHNALGTGNRANATIGRAVRLVAMNVLGAKTGGMDGTSLGHPGKFTFCFAESVPPPGWPPLRSELDYPEDDTTVTVMAAEGPRQVANAQNPNGWDILRTFAAAMRVPSTYSVGKGHQVMLVFGPEHAAAVHGAGISKAEAREFLARETRVTHSELEAAGVVVEKGYQHDMTPGADGKLPVVPTADDIFMVTAGGAGAGWSAYIPSWAPMLHSRAATRRVRLPGDDLPACGPGGCEINWIEET
jgi:hypothetical protein